MLRIILSLICALPSIQASKLRRSTSFDCIAFERDGLAEPNQAHIESFWVCDFEDESTNAEETYTFEENLEKYLSLSSGQTLSIPHDAIDKNKKTISSKHPGIVVSSKSNRRKLVRRTGRHKLLIVRVIGLDAAPNRWKSHLINDFYDDENNLSKRMSACSKNKLQIVPAEGPAIYDLERGIINIEVNQNICGRNYASVSSSVNSKLAQLPGLIYDTKILIMPDCVTMNAAAWANIGGDTIWMMDKYASTPMVQVHEYGHLLGLHHSGKGVDDYGDNTGYMGSELSWTDAGTITCFNPAKTWYLYWYAWRHTSVYPLTAVFNDDLVSLDDVVTGTASSYKMIVRIGGDTNQFFVMFNRAKGVNQGSIGYPDQVVITQQNSRYGISFVQAGLSDGEEWSYDDFGGSNKRLIVKNCRSYVDNGMDRSEVLIYIEGINDKKCGETTSPTSSPVKIASFVYSPDVVSSCSDVPNWKDTLGDACDWYSHGDRCTKFGNTAGTNGLTADEACCVCDEDAIVQDHDSAVPSLTLTSPTPAPSFCLNDNHWYDNGGEKYDCEWYATSPNACRFFGHKFQNFDKVANDACCVCKAQL